MSEPKKEEPVSAAKSKHPTVVSHSGLLGAFRSCASWQDIQTMWRMLPQKQKGDLFEELVQAYPTGSAPGAPAFQNPPSANPDS